MLLPVSRILRKVRDAASLPCRSAGGHLPTRHQGRVRGDDAEGGTAGAVPRPHARHGARLPGQRRLLPRLRGGAQGAQHSGAQPVEGGRAEGRGADASAPQLGGAAGRTGRHVHLRQRGRPAEPPPA